MRVSVPTSAGHQVPSAAGIWCYSLQFYSKYTSFLWTFHVSWRNPGTFFFNLPEICFGRNSEGWSLERLWFCWILISVRLNNSGENWSVLPSTLPLILSILQSPTLAPSCPWSFPTSSPQKGVLFPLKLCGQNMYGGVRQIRVWRPHLARGLPWPGSLTSLSLRVRGYQWWEWR